MLENLKHLADIKILSKNQQQTVAGGGSGANCALNKDECHTYK